MTAFEFATAARVVFGSGNIMRAGEFAASFGKRAWVVLGLRTELASVFLDTLKASGVDYFVQRISGEPTLEILENSLENAKLAGVDLVVAMGGGSAIDLGKAIAALLMNPGCVLDYLEVIGSGKPLEKPSLPLVAIPTTSGTGAEVTKNAVLYSAEHRVKVSMRSEKMFPRVALIDPELTLSLPREVTASSGMDALTQCIEPFVSTRANPLCDSICLQGIALAATSLRKVCTDGKNLAEREKMSLASLMGGLALANSGLGAVHGFAGTIGGMFSAPHGGICARLLPHVCRVNICALKERDPGSYFLERYRQISKIFTGNESSEIDDCVDWLQELVDELQISPLSEYGLHAEHFVTVMEKARQSSSMKGNPIVLKDDELLKILSLESLAGR